MVSAVGLVRHSLRVSEQLEPNPYAPPAEVSMAVAAPSEFAGETRSVALCVVLTVVTLGVYPPVWLLRRQPFLDRLATNERLGSLPRVVLALEAAQLLLIIGGAKVAPLRSFISLVAAVALLVACFRVRAMLQSDFRRTGSAIRLSGAATFFFGIHYLQYKINRAAERAAVAYDREPKKKPRQAAGVRRQARRKRALNDDTVE